MSGNSVLFPVDIDTKKYVLAMKIIKRKAFPDAVAKTLNITADATTKQQIRNVKKDLTVRTKFTINSMMRRGHAINHARGNNVSRMFSRAGTFSRYLWKQEESATYKGMNGGPVPIPTVFAHISSNPKKPLSRRFRLSPGQNLTTNKSIERNMFIGNPQGRKKGVYMRKFTGVEMVRNLESKQIRIKGTNFHSDAVKRFGTKQFIAAQFKKEFHRIMKRKRVQ